MHWELNHVFLACSDIADARNLLSRFGVNLKDGKKSKDRATFAGSSSQASAEGVARRRNQNCRAVGGWEWVKAGISGLMGARALIPFR